MKAKFFVNAAEKSIAGVVCTLDARLLDRLLERVPSSASRSPHTIVIGSNCYDAAITVWRAMRLYFSAEQDVVPPAFTAHSLGFERKFPHLRQKLLEAAGGDTSVKNFVVIPLPPSFSAADASNLMTTIFDFFDGRMFFDRALLSHVLAQYLQIARRARQDYWIDYRVVRTRAPSTSVLEGASR